jgi:hypothetical protein
VTFLFVILSEAKNPCIFLAVPTTFPRSDKKVTPSERSEGSRGSQPSTPLQPFLLKNLNSSFLFPTHPGNVISTKAARPFASGGAEKSASLPRLSLHYRIALAVVLLVSFSSRAIKKFVILSAAKNPRISLLRLLLSLLLPSLFFT